MTFEFSVGGFFHSQEEVKLEDGKVAHRYADLAIMLRGMEPTVFTPTKEAIARFEQEIAFCRHWQAVYNSGALDGEQWTLRVKTRGWSVQCYGSNAWPPEYGLLIRAIRRLLEPEIAFRHDRGLGDGSDLKL